MTGLRSLPRPLRAVTFDCWNTLLYESQPQESARRRARAVAEIASRHGCPTHERAAAAALDRAWQRHIRLWERGVVTGPEDLAVWGLAERGLRGGGAERERRAALAEASLAADIRALAGAAETLQALAARGVRLALVCDTGLSPGRVVRQHLRRKGLAEWLEWLAFSDELRVPKPHPRIFRETLQALGAAPREAVHVGDLRRTDVAGGRGVGMATVRIRDRHDDTTALPEADAVAAHHAELRDLLGLG